MTSVDRLLALRNRPPGRPVMHQTWSDLTFLHWQVDPDHVQSLLPQELTVDTFHGSTYVALVPFTMTGIRFHNFPAVPGTSAFHETNVRTYVIGPDGTPGVWFFSLEAANPLAVAVARNWFGLPYHHASMSILKHEDTITYQSIRRRDQTSSKVESLIPAETGPARPGTLEFWLVERYLLFAQKRNGLSSGIVHHEPYRIAPVPVPTVADTLLAAAGLPCNRPPDLAHYSPGVTVEVFSPKRITV